MIKIASLFLIDLYQRWISPHKGFNCAHHQLHHKDTCSNAVKHLIAEHGLVQAWPCIRQRFADCRSAYQIISAQHADLPIPCDISCDPGIGDCTAGSSASDSACAAPCDLLYLIIGSPRGLVALLLVTLPFSYWFYGRGISTVELSELSTQSTNLITRLSQRNEPSIRVLIESEGTQYYSNIAKLNEDKPSLTLEFDNAPLSYQIDSVKILDARVNLANELLVVGQVLEAYTKPEAEEEGKRFKIKLKRRWHLF